LNLNLKNLINKTSQMIVLFGPN